MSIDSKVVDRELRAVFWPALQEAGFSTRSGRTAWREQAASVDTVNVQSFNEHLASVLHATTYSFAIRVSAFYPAIASRSGMGKFVVDWTRPKEPQCQARSSLEKGIEQAGVGADRGWQDRPDMWFVEPDGSNLDTVVRDARDQVMAAGLHWLERLADLEEVTRRFLETPNRFWGRGVMLEDYGGTLGSPRRQQAAGALAAERRDRSLLQNLVTAMSEDAYWVDHPDDLDRLRVELDNLTA